MVKIGTFYIDEDSGDVYLTSQVSENNLLFINIKSANRYSDFSIRPNEDPPKEFKKFFGEISIQVYQNETTIKIVEDNFEEVLKEKYAQGITRDEIRKLLKEYRKDEHPNV